MKTDSTIVINLLCLFVSKNKSQSIKPKNHESGCYFKTCNRNFILFIISLDNDININRIYGTKKPEPRSKYPA